MRNNPHIIDELEYNKQNTNKKIKRKLNFYTIICCSESERCHCASWRYDKIKF